MVVCILNDHDQNYFRDKDYDNNNGNKKINIE